MRGVRLGIGTAFCILGLAAANTCPAASGDIEVVKAEGSITASDASGKNQRPITVKSALRPKDILTTGPNGRVVVRVGSNGYIVVEKDSKVAIDSTQYDAGSLRHIAGMIYYAMHSLMMGNRKIDVRTPAMTVGIRGTRFLIVDLPDRKEIDMRKGQVNVASPEGEFEIHRKAEQDAFEAYKQEAKDAIENQKKEFEKYKSQTQKEFVEYKREFSLGAGRMASLDGKRVEDKPLSVQSTKDMESSESFAEQWLNEIRD